MNGKSKKLLGKGKLNVLNMAKKMWKCRGKSPVTPKGVCQHRRFKWPFPSVILHLQINSIDLISKIQMVNSVQATEIR